MKLMSENGTTISYYMLGGKTRGCVRCTRKVWSIISYKIPRAVAGECACIKDLKRSGIYFLLGYDDNDELTVYVGQAARRHNHQGVLARMLEPHSDTIDGWAEAVVLTSKGDELGATELCYLEHTFYRLVREANRAKLLNSQKPAKGNLSEEEESDMLDYIEQAKVMLRALGYSFLVAARASVGKNRAQETDEAQPTPLYLSVVGVKASGYYTADGFIVNQGSGVSPIIVKSCPKSVLSAREKYKDVIKDGLLEEDLVFSSPSAAAGFIAGGSINGLDYWKTADGTSLKSLMIDRKSTSDRAPSSANLATN